MNKFIRPLIVFAVLLIFCIIQWGCSGKTGIMPASENQTAAGQAGFFAQKIFHGHVEFPDPDVDPSKYSVVVPSGEYTISKDFDFDVPMNAGTTGLITVTDTTGRPILMKVFPKHDLLYEQEPVIDAESTAVALVYMNPFMARLNKPLQAAALIELIKQTKPLSHMNQAIISSFSQRQCAMDIPGLGEMAASAFSEVLSMASPDRESLSVPQRAAQNDEQNYQFFDRDGKPKDEISFTGFEFLEGANSVNLHYSNEGCRWWMVTIDSTSTEPLYTPNYSSGSLAGHFVALIPPASLSHGSITDILSQIISSSVGSIAGLLGSQKEEIITQLANVATAGTPSTGQIEIILPGNSQNYQMGLYSLGFHSTLGDASPPSPDRCLTPTMYQLFYEMVCPIVSNIFDGEPYADADTTYEYLKTQQFTTLLSEIRPQFTTLREHLESLESSALDDCFGIIGKVLAKPDGMWFLRHVLFNGQIPQTSLTGLLQMFLSYDKGMAVSDDFATFLLETMNTFAIPDFDSYIISLQDVCEKDNNSSYLEGVEVPFGGDSGTKTVCNPQDKADWYKFICVSDVSGSLELTVTNDSGPCDITLYSEAQAQGGDTYLAWKQASPFAAINLSTLSLIPGTYYVRIRDIGNDYNFREYLFENNGGQIGVPDKPVDITPSWLSFQPGRVCIVDNYAYVTDSDYGLFIFDITTPLEPVPVKAVKTAELAKGVAVTNGFAFVAVFKGLQIIDISSPTSAEIIKTVDLPTYGEDVTISAGFAYVADSSAGIQIIDISTPSSAHVVNTIGQYYSATSITVSGSYLYVTDHFAGLLIYDIGSPGNPQIVSTFNTPGSTYDIDVLGTYAYVADYWEGLQIIDISSPESPVLVSSVDTSSTAESVKFLNGYVYVTDNTFGLQIIDVSQPDSAHIVKNIDDSPGYATGVDVSGGYAYVALNQGGLQIVDISSPGSAYVAHTISTLPSTYGVAVKDAYAYAGDYFAGFSVVDISSPGYSKIVKTIDINATFNSIAISGDYAFVADQYSGLRIIDISSPASAYILNTVDTPGLAYDVAVAEGYAYITDYSFGLQIIDIIPPETAHIVSTVETPSAAYGVAVRDLYAYVADDDTGLLVIDISTPGSANIVGTVQFEGLAKSVAISGNYAYVAADYYGLQIINITSPASPYWVRNVDTYGQATDIALSGNYAYLGASEYGLYIIDITTPISAHVFKNVNTASYHDSYALSVAITDGYAYLGDHGGGLRIIKLW